MLRLAIEAAYVRVTVHDSDDRPPALREGYDAESGRGLWLVDALSEGQWGVGPGRVWMAVARPCGSSCGSSRRAKWANRQYALMVPGGQMERAGAGQSRQKGAKWRCLWDAPAPTCL